MDGGAAADSVVVEAGGLARGVSDRGEVVFGVVGVRGGATGAGVALRDRGQPALGVVGVARGVQTRDIDRSGQQRGRVVSRGDDAARGRSRGARGGKDIGYQRGHAAVDLGCFGYLVRDLVIVRINIAPRVRSSLQKNRILAIMRLYESIVQYFYKRYFHCFGLFAVKSFMVTPSARSIRSLKMLYYTISPVYLAHFFFNLISILEIKPDNWQIYVNV